MNALDRAEAGAANTPLSAGQKRDLILLARRAWEKAGALESFDAWRHRQILLCVERPGLRACTNADYGYVSAHFLALVGQADFAHRQRDRADANDRTMALAKLDAELDAAADVIENGAAYVAAIARARFKTTLIRTDLNAKQIWGLVFDLRRNAQRRRRVQGAR